MFSYVFIYFILITSAAYSTNTTISQNIHNSEANKSSSNSSKIINETQNTIMSEGGAVPLEKPAYTTLPKETSDTLQNIDKEIANSTTKKKTSVHPRKEAPKDVSFEQKNMNTTASVYSKSINTTVIDNKTVNKTTTPVHKKPLLLSDEALARSDSLGVKTPKLSSTLDFDYTPLPSSEVKKKITQMSANSHPGMIIPLVITILVVPVLAVLGYMALRRGQEAWKNRHYKRMDFLLDGMYND